MTYPLYVKPSTFWGYDFCYCDDNNLFLNAFTLNPTPRKNDEQKIGSITYYTTLPEILPPTTRNIYSIGCQYIEETTDPHIYIFYKKYKYYAIITLDDPDTLRRDNIIKLDFQNVSPIQSTTAVIFNNLTRCSYERQRITLFDTSDRINHQNEKNITTLGYNAVLRTELLPPDNIVWNNYRFCKFSESDSSRATYLIDENDLITYCVMFIADKKTNAVSVHTIKDTDFMDIVADYLDDDTSDNLAVIKPSENLAYNDLKILKTKTFYRYKGEFING